MRIAGEDVGSVKRGDFTLHADHCAFGVFTRDACFMVSHFTRAQVELWSKEPYCHAILRISCHVVR
jgi:hypothetical protein